MPKIYKNPECDVLLRVRTEEMVGRPSKKGLNKTELWVVSWFKGAPVLERRQLFYKEEIGEWIYMKNLGLRKEDWLYILSDQKIVRAITEAICRKID